MPLSRKKSCVRCREAKTRCNQLLPSCSRCLDKNVRCVYESERVAPYSLASPRPGQRMHILSMPNLGSVDEILASDITAPEFPEGPASVSAWSSTDSALGAELANSTPPNSIPLNIMKEVEQNVKEDIWLLQQAENARQNKDKQIMPLRGSTLTERAYSRRRIDGQDVLASVVLGQLKSYPRMLIEGDRLPPFIHPPCYLDEELSSACRASGRHVCFGKELSICASLVKMFYSRNPKTSEFVWETIHNEGERIIQQYITFTPQEQLAGLQSVIILLLLQAEDPDSVEGTGGLFLVRIVTSLVGQMIRYHEWRSEPGRDRPRRADWVWRESIRRCVMVLSVVNFLLEGMMGPAGSICDSSKEFQRSSLPCGRGLWEARSTKAWMNSYDCLLENSDSVVVLTIQDLMVSTGEREWLLLVADPNDGHDKEHAIMRWCEDMDSLGTLIWMSMPLHISIVKHGPRMVRLEE